jgi:hypothetical protein
MFFYISPNEADVVRRRGTSMTFSGWARFSFRKEIRRAGKFLNENLQQPGNHQFGHIKIVVRKSIIWHHNWRKTNETGVECSLAISPFSPLVLINRQSQISLDFHISFSEEPVSR